MAHPLGERELDIIQELWTRGSATVAEVHASLIARGHDVAYNTIQTMLNRLETKRIVARDTTERAHRYRALFNEGAAAGGAIRRLTRRFFRGSSEALAARLVESDLNDEQLNRLERLIRSRRGHAR